MNRPTGPTHLLPAALVVLLLASVAAGPRTAWAQIPDTFTNLQVLPEDIDRDELVGMMRDFTFALGVRCTHCHVNNGTSFADTDFASDEKPEKETARRMIRMLAQINQEMLPALSTRGTPPVVMTCKTCHRGVTRPFLLSQDLILTAHEQGADAMVARYRELRERYEVAGAYDFREQETSEAADDLAEDGLTAEAIALQELNAEYHPESTAIWSTLGARYSDAGRVDDAIAAYERVLAINPRARGIQERLDALKQ